MTLAMARLGVLLLAGLLLAPQARAGEHAVSQKQKEFQPSELSVEVGDEVVFLNDDEISHNVFSRSEGAKFNLKIQRPGEHKRQRFQEPGEVVIRCAIHPKMKMTVHVKPKGEESAATTSGPCTVSDDGNGDDHCEVDASEPMSVDGKRAEDAPESVPAAPEAP